MSFPRSSNSSPTPARSFSSFSASFSRSSEIFFCALNASSAASAALFAALSSALDLSSALALTSVYTFALPCSAVAIRLEASSICLDAAPSAFPILSMSAIAAFHAAPISSTPPPSINAANIAAVPDMSFERFTTTDLIGVANQFSAFPNSAMPSIVFRAHSANCPELMRFNTQSLTPLIASLNPALCAIPCPSASAASPITFPICVNSPLVLAAASRSNAKPAAPRFNNSSNFCCGVNVSSSWIPYFASISVLPFAAFPIRRIADVASIPSERLNPIAATVAFSMSSAAIPRFIPSDASPFT